MAGVTKEEQRDAKYPFTNNQASIVGKLKAQRGEMRERAPDRRVRKTRRLLHQALMSLALDKRYESITVQEILDRADVGRSTFYMHFHDKDELLRWGLQHLSNFLRCAQAGTPTVPGRSYERVIGFSLRMFQHANEYRAVIRALLSSTAETVVRRHLDSVLASIVKVEIKMEMQRRKRMRGPMSAELLTYFVVSSFVSVFTWWLNSESPLRPEDINAAYQQLVLPCLASIFG